MMMIRNYPTNFDRDVERNEAAKNEEKNDEIEPTCAHHTAGGFVISRRLLSAGTTAALLRGFSEFENQSPFLNNSYRNKICIYAFYC